MTLQTKAFQWSIGLHILVVLAILILQFSADSPTRIAVIDFSLADSMPSVAAGPAAPKPKKEPRQKVEQLMPRPTEKIKEQPITSPEAQKQKPAELSLSGKEISAPAPGTMQDANPAAATDFSPSAEAADSTYGGTGGSSAGHEGMDGDMGQVKANYLKEHFSYIRDRINRNISYPHIARKMGWYGRVKIAFVICEDGSVIDVSVIESCGCTVLDQNTVDTVKKTAPFPCPPVRAEIRMAISYRLD